VAFVCFGGKLAGAVRASNALNDHEFFLVLAFQAAQNLRGARRVVGGHGPCSIVSGAWGGGGGGGGDGGGGGGGGGGLGKVVVVFLLVEGGGGGGGNGGGGGWSGGGVGAVG